MSGQLAGKVAVVTGATSGIGLAIARRFSREGATVFVTGRRQAQAEEVAAEIGFQAVGVECDVSDLASIDRLYEAVAKRAGRIDVLVANAALATTATLGQITEEHFDAVFATNVKGVVFGVQKAMPLLSSGASVILIGSTSSHRPDHGLEVYGATKAALRNFVRSWTSNTKEHDFRVNVLSPGATLTRSLLSVMAAGDPAGAEDRLAQLTDAIPIGRIGDPDEIAEVATLLASDKATFVNGAEWFIDGGYAQV